MVAWRRGRRARPALVVLLGVAGCLASETYPCLQDAQCIGSPRGPGKCLAGWCAYEDDDCPNAWRYSDNAGDGRASTCFVPSDDPSEVGTDVSTDAGTSSDDSGTSSSSSTGAPSSGPNDATGDPCEGVDCAPGETCIGGVCFDGSDNGVCDPAGSLGSAFCNDCALDFCCELFERCNGSVEFEEMPVCGQLGACVLEAIDAGTPSACADVSGTQGLDACVLAACPQFVDGYDDWVDLATCLEKSCPVSCG